MNLLAGLRNLLAPATERKYDVVDLARDWFNGRAVKSGVTVNLSTALQVTTVLACARVIAEGIAQVPLQVMRADGKTRLPAMDHPLYPLLFRRPNEWMTSFEFRDMMGLHLVLAGNFYAFKSVAAGRVRALIPLDPGSVTVKRTSDYALTYRVTMADGASRDVPAEAMWHVRGPSWNGYLGLEPVSLAREAIGLALSTEESHALMHKNGVQSTGVYTVEGTLNPQQFQQLYDWIAKYQKGGQYQQAPLIIDRGAKWTPSSMTGVDAQHLETRRFQIEEICRAFRVMPIMIGYSDKASTYASAEQMFLSHVVHTLAPWYERIEQSIDCHLLTPEESRAGMYAKFGEEALLRGAMKDTSEYLTRLVSNGILTRNEARERLDENPIEGLDEPLVPMNATSGAQPTEMEP